MKPHAIGHTHRPLPTHHVIITDDGDGAGDDDGGDDAQTEEKSPSSFTSATHEWQQLLSETGPLSVVHCWA